MIKIIKIITAIPVIILVGLMTGCGNGIFEGVKRGDVEAVREMLDKDLGLIRSRDKEGFTPLQRAAQKGRRQVAELLIERGAPVDERSRDGTNLTPLHLAAGEGHTETAELLLEKGADINAAGKSSRYRGWSALVFAAWNHHKDMVELLIRKGARVVPASLWIAVYMGYRDIAELLLAKGADIDGPSTKTWRPLHIAVERGYAELVRLLLEHGADVNRKSYGNSTPLHVIIYWKRDHIEITRLLLTYGADVGALNSYGETPLHQAAYKGFTGSVSLLLEKGAGVEIMNRLEQTPLDLADHEGCQAVVRLLLSMHTAAGKGDRTAVASLIKTYPQMVNARDLDGKTPLHHAAENNRLDIADLLIANGAVVDACSKYSSIQLLDGAVAKLLVPRVGRVKRIKDSKTPLDFAVKKDFRQMAHLLEAHMKKN